MVHEIYRKSDTLRTALIQSLLTLEQITREVGAATEDKIDIGSKSS